jgi:hypothetical protein
MAHPAHAPPGPVRPACSCFAAEQHSRPWPSPTRQPAPTTSLLASALTAPDRASITAHQFQSASASLEGATEWFRTLMHLSMLTLLEVDDPHGAGPVLARAGSTRPRSPLPSTQPSNTDWHCVLPSSLGLFTFGSPPPPRRTHPTHSGHPSLHSCGILLCATSQCVPPFSNLFTLSMHASSRTTAQPRTPQSTRRARTARSPRRCPPSPSARAPRPSQSRSRTGRTRT